MDFSQQVQAVTRSTRQVRDHHLVELEQTFPVEPAVLWDALTSPDAMSQWFDGLDGDLKEGGRYSLTVVSTDVRYMRRG